MNTFQCTEIKAGELVFRCFDSEPVGGILLRDEPMFCLGVFPEDQTQLYGDPRPWVRFLTRFGTRKLRMSQVYK